MKEYKHTFNLGFLNYNIEVILTDDIAVSRASYDEEIGHPYTDFGNTAGLHSCNTEQYNMISFIFISPNAKVTTIAHEAFHAVVRVCKSFDIPLKESTEEVYAYMLDFITGEIVKFKEAIKKRTKKAKS